MRLSNIEIGNKIGPFTVVEKMPYRAYQGSVIWKCKCDCGDHVELISTQLFAHATKSCHREIPKKIRVTKDKALARRFTKYKGSAKTRGIPFEISVESFANLISQNCTYCDSPGPNGIDRKHSEIGYKEGNCLSCCTVCNRAKSNMDPLEFHKYLLRLANFVLRQS